MRSTAISKYYKSFSGTDTIAFLIFPGVNPITIGSLTTISYSMFRNKVPVINLGRTNINGITRGSRVYAGTMVFTLLNKHWLRELQDQVPYLKDFPTLKVDELPLFDIMILSANEYGSSAHMFIYGIDFTDEAQTVSVEDLFTENVFKFVAREVSVFDNFIVTESEKREESYYTIKSSLMNNYYIEKNAPIITTGRQRYKEFKSLSRTLYLINSHPMTGNDVGMIQALLNLAISAGLEITQIFDRKMEEAVKRFQLTRGLIVNGLVDNEVYTKLLEYTQEANGSKYMQVINKSGAYVYREPDSNSNITQVLPYLAHVEVDQHFDKKLFYYKTNNGYISKYDVYDYNNSNAVEYETLYYGKEGDQVNLYQKALEKVYDNYKGKYQQGIFDEPTEDYTKKFQRDNDMVETGSVDYYTWNVIMNLIGSESTKDFIKNHTQIIPSKEPGRYKTKGTDLANYQTMITNLNNQQVKYTTISKYKNKQTKTDTKTITFKNETVAKLTDFENMFTDDPSYGTPTDVYYIIYPHGSSPYKWHFQLEG